MGFNTAFLIIHCTNFRSSHEIPLERQGRQLICNAFISYCINTLSFSLLSIDFLVLTGHFPKERLLCTNRISVLFDLQFVPLPQDISEDIMTQK